MPALTAPMDAHDSSSDLSSFNCHAPPPSSPPTSPPTPPPRSPSPGRAVSSRPSSSPSMAGPTRSFFLWLDRLGDLGPANQPIRSFFSDAALKFTKWAFPSAPNAPVSCNCRSIMPSLFDIHEIPISSVICPSSCVLDRCRHTKLLLLYIARLGSCLASVMVVLTQFILLMVCRYDVLYY